MIEPPAFPKAQMHNSGSRAFCGLSPQERRLLLLHRFANTACSDHQLRLIMPLNQTLELFLNNKLLLAKRS